MLSPETIRVLLPWLIGLPLAAALALPLLGRTAATARKLALGLALLHLVLTFAVVESADRLDASLGLSAPLAPVTSLALVPNFDRPQLREGDVPLPPVLPWPRRSFVTPADTQVFPAPAAQTMRYARIFQMPGTEKKKVATGTQPAKPKDPNATATPASSPGHSPSRPAGHQVTVVRPPLSLTLPNFMR
jgi:hypothetical protein